MGNSPANLPKWTEFGYLTGKPPYKCVILAHFQCFRRNYMGHFQLMVDNGDSSKY